MFVKTSPTATGPLILRLDLFLPILLLFPSGEVSAQSPDYQATIRPLLSRSCFQCHGPDAAARKAGLRLDLGFAPDTIAEDLVIPGDPEGSLLFQRISALDPEDRMPPEEAPHQLTPDEIDQIGLWIRNGADWSRHWSFEPPRRIPAPEVSETDWCIDELDRFILHQLEQEGLAPSGQATPELLLRRVCLDLTGLPPSVEMLDTHASEQGADWYERAVDRLLETDAYGERMAVHWMELARYADTHGYQTDVHRPTWPWRDWVIKAFNENLPYDQFITWQLAGDLLPDAGREQRLATAFNRLHRQTNEGGSIEEEFRVEYVADRVATYGTVMLGLTTECARCHDHKFDPMSQVEYYRLFAYFDDIDESGLYSHFTNATPTPALSLSTPEQDQRLQAVESGLRTIESRLMERDHTGLDAFEAWIADPPSSFEIPGLLGAYDFESIADGRLENDAAPENPGALSGAPSLTDGVRGNGLHMSGDDNAHFPGVGEFDRNTPFTISLSLRINEAAERNVILHRSRAWTDAGSQGYQLLLEEGRASWSLVHFWPGNAISIRTTEPLPTGRWVQVTVTSDGSSRAEGLSISVDGERAGIEIVRDGLTRAITGGGPGAMTIGQRFRDRGFRNGDVDELRVFDRCLTRLEIRHLFDGVALESARLEDPAALLPYFLATVDATYGKDLHELRTLRSERASILDGTTEIMTMSELPTPRTSHVLERGRYDLRGEQVPPGVPDAIMPLPESARTDRLGLARWTTDPNHPLTARVAVNRLWQIVFGSGIVATSEDFGSQGAHPSHPDLLDMLALDFIESGWDVKAMMRRLVLSATYRQASNTTPGHRTIDPGNRLLSHGPSRRLTAEMLRDQALAASGLLVDRVGGPSVHPHQPSGLWQEKNGQVYPKGDGDALYRRSLYTFWKRTSPPPAMIILDAGKRNVCITRRSSTNTPLQALVILNDPQFVEAARVLAERASEDGGTTPREQILFAFRGLTGRHPSREETDLLMALYETERDSLTPTEALALSETGDAPRREGLDPTHVAAMTIVCSTILNSDASVMKR